MEKDQSADGLRGWAALNVFASHFLLALFPLGFVHFFPWVAQSGAKASHFDGMLSAPFLSILWNGRFPVSVFFVLSGYVLTNAFVDLRDIDALRSKVARRYFRLGIPVFFSVMLAYSLMKLGAYHSVETVQVTSSAWLASQILQGPPDLGAALKEGLYESIFTIKHAYNPALWTMRIEFFGSMLIFSYRALAWPGRREIVAAAIYVALVFFLDPMLWPLYLAFLLGSHIGDMPRPKTAIHAWAAAVVGIALGSVDQSAIFAWFHLMPLEFETRSALYSVLGGALLVYGVRGGAFKRLLLGRVSQFLGRVSYSLYLVHLPIIFSVGCGLFNWMHSEKGFARESAAAMSLALTTMCVIAVAWIFERLVDSPAIRFSKAIFRPSPIARLRKRGSTSDVAEPTPR
ncbi:acyltransferase [Variovorax sp. WS11]|uniref:acyltransferase family protein n=1 Tax=Variovorax sp. WS11 TaxID=1105204 RepID=UPI0013D925D9|nr:acyltransferase [Variovorax sp. WS11]NDZ14506.1 acyltransferase [Variovorax sp. WS11]